MEDIERIRQRILDDARKQADRMLGGVREECQRRLETARRRIARDLENRLRRLQEDLARHRQQQLDHQAFQHRLEILRRKREILEGIFETARRRFVETPSYRQWLERSLEEVGDLEGEVFCCERDRAVCRTVLARLGEEGRGGLRLAEAEPDPPIDGGFLLRTERFDLDLSVRAAFEDLRERVMSELAALAFSGLEVTGGG